MKLFEKHSLIVVFVVGALVTVTSVTFKKSLAVTPSSTRSKQPPHRPSAPIRGERPRFNRYVKSWTALRQENVVIQQRDYSCGAAALATILQYHWEDNITETELLIEVFKLLTVEELKERIENGLSLTDLRRLSVRMGYLATIGKLEFSKLRESKIPLVVGIIVNEFDHFVVYRGMDNQYVYLADPSRGNVRTPIPEFKKQWQENAVLVVIKKGESSKKRSGLLVHPEEKTLGQLNRLYLRNRLSDIPFVLSQ